jgi:hypothetical protein
MYLIPQRIHHQPFCALSEVIPGDLLHTTKTCNTFETAIGCGVPIAHDTSSVIFVIFRYSDLVDLVDLLIYDVESRWRLLTASAASVSKKPSRTFHGLTRAYRNTRVAFSRFPLNLLLCRTGNITATHAMMDACDMLPMPTLLVSRATNRFRRTLAVACPN